MWLTVRQGTKDILEDLQNWACVKLCACSRPQAVYAVVALYSTGQTKVRRVYWNPARAHRTARAWQRRDERGVQTSRTPYVYLVRRVLLR
jgi:hypothetical protein